MPSPLPADMADRRAARRKQVDEDDELKPLEKELLKSIHTHGDEMIDTIAAGFGRLERSTKMQTYVGMGMGFVLVLVVVIGALQIGGVDVAATTDAVERLAPLGATSSSTTIVTETKTEPPALLPGAEQPTNTAGADHNSDAPPSAPTIPPAGE